MDDNQRTQAAALLPARRALAIAGRVLTVLIALIAILATLFTIVSVATFDKVEGKGLFSYKFSIVRSDSMKNEGRQPDGGEAGRHHHLPLHRPR